MKLFLTAFVVSAILLFVCIALFQGLAVVIVPALLIAVAAALYADVSKRLNRIEQLLGLAPEPEEAMTITERWEAERKEREENENNTSTPT